MQSPETPLAAETLRDFGERILNFQYRHGRRHLPWQMARTPYRVWVSEIMLQQTQVATVVDYFTRFMQTFPDLPALAEASLETVLSHWQGLGYYTRARNLHRAAQILHAQGLTELPLDEAILLELPGIGRSTAGAILSLAGNLPYPILDANVKRVLARYFGISLPATGRGLAVFWDIATRALPHTDPRWYNQGLMDLGSSLCTARSPQCNTCPLAAGCVAYNNQSVADYPIPSRTVKVQSVELHWIYLYTPQAVCLIQRPLTGIWGGLYTFPELLWDNFLCMCPSAQNWPVQHWPAFSHTLSHRKMRIHVHSCALKTTAACPILPTPDSQWYNWETALSLGKPVPVARLLREPVQSTYDPDPHCHVEEKHL